MSSAPLMQLTTRTLQGPTLDSSRNAQSSPICDVCHKAIAQNGETYSFCALGHSFHLLCGKKIENEQTVCPLCTDNDDQPLVDTEVQQDDVGTSQIVQTTERPCLKRLIIVVAVGILVGAAYGFISLLTYRSGDGTFPDAP